MGMGMDNGKGRLDTLILIPFEPKRMSLGRGDRPSTHFEIAFAELEEHLGFDLQTARTNTQLDIHPGLSKYLLAGDGAQMVVRSAASLVLSSCAERAGLNWATVDPYEKDLGWWRRKLEEYREQRPVTVALNTTFITKYSWTADLAWIVRRIFPEAKLLIGGYQYANDTNAFLNLDADVFCIGEGEVRFAKIVQACRDDPAALERIPGLVIRAPDRSLRSTGHAPPISLDELAPTNYALSARIDPPTDIERDHLDVHVETQRGCMYSCQFCTFRTIQLPEQQDPRNALTTILATRAVKDAFIGLQDATATTPGKRWDQLMDLVIEAGGTPHPMWCYTRVTDINDERAAKMARAGLGAVQIGQESGDQRILDAMIKGTKVQHVLPAIDSLGRAGLNAEMSYIHGFPGETRESLENTRNMILTCNDAHKARPVVLAFFVHVWQEQDLAVARAREADSGLDLYTEQLRTIIAASRIPHAPANRYVITRYAAGDRQGIGFLLSKERYEYFALAKGIDRGFAEFLQRQLDGTPIDDAALHQATEQISRFIKPRRAARSVFARVRRGVRPAIEKWKNLEARMERGERGQVGPLTRALLAREAFRTTGEVRQAVRTALRAEYPRLWKNATTEHAIKVGASAATADGAPPTIDVLAGDLVTKILKDRATWKLKKTTRATEPPPARTGRESQPPPAPTRSEPAA